MILIVALLRPATVRTDRRPADAAVVVAVDTSKSMTLPDGEGGIRFEAQRLAASDLFNGLAKFDTSLSLHVIAYDDTTKPLSISSENKTSGNHSGSFESLQPTGRSTDLAAAMTATITAAQGQPIAGVVLMGDGTQTAPVTSGGATRVARTLDSLGVPLWTVPIGPAAGEGNARDVAIESLSDHYQFFAGNQIEIAFQVVTRGLAGIDIPVRLSWEDHEGKTEEVAVRRAQSRRSRDSIAMKMSVTAPDPGTYRLIVQADTQDGETITRNNRQMAFVDVREGGGRVLYLEGSLRQEYAFVRRSLRRFPDLDLVARWIPRDTQASWPVDLPGLFEPGRFDVYLIGDLEFAALGNDQWQQLAKAVDQGAGLVMIGGAHTLGRGEYDGTVVAGMLPIEMNTNANQNLIEEPFSLKLVRSHPITDLGGRHPEEVWRSLPLQLGANRFDKLKVAPGVEALLQSDTGQPMLVVGGYGRGRVATLAFDSTYRWWRTGHSDVHRRFWRQLMLWLLLREETHRETILVEMDTRRFATDQSPEFRASVNSTGESADSVSLVAEIIRDRSDDQGDNQGDDPGDDSGKTWAVSTTEVSSEKAASSIRGEIPPLEPGIYRLLVRDKNDRETLPPQEIAFQVIDQSLELSRPMADPVFLQQLAHQTAAQGGRSFRPDEMSELLEVITQRREMAETAIIEKNRLGDGPKTGWPMFLLFAGALSTEWFLRRRWHLV